MKRVMWTARQQLQAIAQTRDEDPARPRLFDVPATERQTDLVGLRDQLMRHFNGRQVTFDNVQLECLDWDYIESHFRDVLKRMEKENIVKIKRVSSKTRGLKELDLIQFP